MTDEGGFALDMTDPRNAKFYWLLVYRGRLHLETTIGLKFKQSTLKAVNRQFGQNFKRKEAALEWLREEIEKINEEVRSAREAQPVEGS